MPKIAPEIEAYARIKAVGVGGGGVNTITHMVSNRVRGVEFIAMNTDAQALHQSRATKKIHIGKSLTRGLGTGMSPDVGKKAAEETLEEVQAVVKGADMVFVTCGLGGGTGTGGAPIVARTAREQGVLTVGVVTKPFYFEGAQRMRIAEEGLDELRKNVDALIVIPNDRLLGIIDKETTFFSAFAMCDEVLRRAVEGISDLITTPGVINLDFADIKSVMQNAGSALMGIGSATGEKRAEDAARDAINSPLLDISIEGARGVLFAIAGGDDLTMFEVQEAAKVITESIDKDARVIFGAIHDEKLKKNEVKVTVIATGFPDQQFKKALFGEEATKGGNLFGGILDNKKREKEEEAKPKEKEKERVFMTDANREPQAPRRINLVNKEKEPEKKEEDEWSSIPAFLRRRK